MVDPKEFVLNWFSIEVLGLFQVVTYPILLRSVSTPFLGLSLVSDNSYLLLAFIGNDLLAFTESKVGTRNFTPVFLI